MTRSKPECQPRSGCSRVETFMCSVTLIWPSPTSLCQQVSPYQLKKIEFFDHLGIFLISANVVKYSYARNENVHVKLVRVHTKNLRQLLRHILLVRHFRLEMFGSGSTNLSYEKVATASPCDLGEVKVTFFSIWIWGVLSSSLGSGLKYP